MTCPIQNKALWEKVKDLLGTDEDKFKLDKYNATGKLSANDYWRIKAKWAANKHRKRDEDSQLNTPSIKNSNGT